MIDKNKMPLAVGVAFVAFTTQFGGGFASGAQLYQYFLNFGIWSLVLPVLTQFLIALCFWYGLRYAFRNRTYDYRSFSDKFYGKYRFIFSNLYELTYLIMIGTASAAAFATGGATLSTLTGIPYWLCTLTVGGFIFVIALYGTNLVRKAASTLSVLIIAGLLLVFIPNIIAQWDTILASVGRMAEGSVPAGSSESGLFGAALWSALLYAFFQIPSVGLMYQHTEVLTDERQVTRASVYMFIVNTAIMVLAIFCMMAVAFSPELEGASVPMLILVEQGVGAGILTPVISILMILGAVSTGVNMIAGIVTRSVNAVERRLPEEKKNSGHMARSILFSLAFTLIAFGIAQFGLINVVKKGYAYLGYAGILSVAIPFLIHAVYSSRKEAAAQAEAV